MTVHVVRYEHRHAEEWDRFIREAKNGLFLFERAYMDYHSHRFADHSLVLIDTAGRPIALLPANSSQNTLESHGGLTFGGVISDGRMRLDPMMSCVDAIARYLRTHGFASWLYKAIPHIYHRSPAQEDLYALWRHGARTTRTDPTTTIQSNARLPLQNRRKRALQSAAKSGLYMGASSDFRSFWPILTSTLAAHNVTPVHSLDEITLLHSRFRDNIRLFTSTLHGEILAGVVVYVHRTVAHFQYVAASMLGKELHALDLLIESLISVTFRHLPFVDFGISSEDGGLVLNTGLSDFKEGFGGRTVTHQTFTLDLR